jgi:hypothetical protein
MRGFDLDQIRWHPARNTSSETIPPYGVMRISSTETVARRTRYIVAKPNTAFQRLYLVNGPQQIRAGKVGSGTFDISYALCDSSASPLLAESWGAKNDSWKLWQHRPGFFMLGNYQESGAKQRGIVRPWEVIRLRARLSGSLSQGGSASAVIDFRDGGAWTASDFTALTVYDDLLPTSGSLASGTVVWIEWYGERW